MKAWKEPNRTGKSRRRNLRRWNGCPCLISHPLWTCRKKPSLHGQRWERRSDTWYSPCLGRDLWNDYWSSRERNSTEPQTLCHWVSECSGSFALLISWWIEERFSNIHKVRGHIIFFLTVIKYLTGRDMRKKGSFGLTSWGIWCERHGHRSVKWSNGSWLSLYRKLGRPGQSQGLPLCPSPSYSLQQSRDWIFSHKSLGWCFSFKSQEMHCVVD